MALLVALSPFVRTDQETKVSTRVQRGEQFESAERGEVFFLIAHGFAQSADMGLSDQGDPAEPNPNQVQFARQEVARLFPTTDTPSGVD